MANSKNREELTCEDRAHEALEAIRVYLEQAIKFLNGKRTTPPDARPLTRKLNHNSSILSARCDGEDRFSTGMPFIACIIADDLAPTETRSERYFDPWYFVVMRLLELAGGRFRFDRSKNKYFYLAYADAIGTKGNHYLRRIIANPAWWADMRERPTGNHYDYRRATLKTTAKNVVRALGQKTRKQSRTRDDAVRFAVGVFKKRHGKTSKSNRLGIGAADYESLLRLSLEIADAVHEKMLALALPRQRVAQQAGE